MIILLILTVLVVYFLYLLFDYYSKNKLVKEQNKIVTASDVMGDILFEPSQTGRFFDPIVHSSPLQDIFSPREKIETAEASDVLDDMNFEPLTLKKEMAFALANQENL